MNTSSKSRLHLREHGETAPPLGGSKIDEELAGEEHDEGVLPTERTNDVTEEGVLGLPQKKKGLSSSFGDLKPLVKNKKITQGRKRRRS